MKKVSRMGIVVLLMLGALTACMGDGNGYDSNGDAQGVPPTLAPMETTTVAP